MHQLDGAYLRIERAGEHLADLETRIRTFTNAEKDNVPFQFDTDTCQIAIGPFGEGTALVQNLQRLSPSWSILIGEIAYNLRSALDYLVYELAFLDSGSEQGGTQFPIEKTPEGFRERRKTFLKGLSVKHIASIEALQLYKGTTWTQLLASLSNPDKHRHLSPVVNLTESVINVSALEPGGFGDVTKHVYRTKNKFGDVLDMHVQTDFVLSVTFSDGTPIIKTLQKLIFQVRDTLDAFKSEF
jgi:hypothetical protein